MASTPQNQDEKKAECGVPCALNTGVSLAVAICTQAGVTVNDIEDQIFDAKITVQEGMDQMEGRLREKGDEFQLGLFQEAEKIMKEAVEKAEAREAQAQTEVPPAEDKPQSEDERKKEAVCFISDIAHQDMVKDLDAMIKDREKTLDGIDPNTKFAESQREIVQKLRAAREAVKNAPACQI